MAAVFIITLLYFVICIAEQCMCMLCVLCVNTQCVCVCCTSVRNTWIVGKPEERCALYGRDFAHVFTADPRRTIFVTKGFFYLFFFYLLPLWQKQYRHSSYCRVLERKTHKRTLYTKKRYHLYRRAPVCVVRYTGGRDDEIFH